MLIEANKVVTFHYTLREPGQDILEDSRETDAPAVYLHGHHGLIKGLEDALTGKQAGDKTSVTLTEDQAYGPRREDSIQRVSIKHVINPEGKKVTYKPGMVVQLNTQHGPHAVIVVKVGLKTLDVDINHPYAGKTLTFDIEVTDVRDATPEEIDHGHVHGEGGHQH